MEVWQNADGISLGQGKYVVEILKRFGMMDYKAMATPMESNLKLLSDTASETVDAMMYHQMIGSLMYLTKTRPNIYCAVNTLSQYLTDLRHVHLTTAKHMVVTMGRPGFICNAPTTPLAHWPFWQHTVERPEVSPEVILDGSVKDSSVFNQVL